MLLIRYQTLLVVQLKGVTDVANNIVDGVSNFANNTKEKVGGIFGKVGGWFSDTFNLKKLLIRSNQTSNKKHNQ